MAAVASNPPWHPYRFGQHPRPEPSSEPFIPPRPINFPGPRVNNDYTDGPVYPRNDYSQFDRAAFGEYPESGPPSDRPDPPRTRNKHVTFSTPSGGYYTTNTSPAAPTLQNVGPKRSGSVWSRISGRFRGIADVTEPRPDIPTIPQSPGSNREQQIQQVIALLLPYVPTAEPMIRPMINLVHDSQLLQQLIDTLNRPLTQQQFLEIQDSFTIPPDEQKEFVKALANPEDPGIPTLLAQFREFVEHISGRPISSTSGASSRVCRMISSFLRNSLRCRRREGSQSTNVHTIPTTSVPTPAQSSTKQPSETKKFPIHELLRSRFRGFIVEPFTCTGCETNIPANRTRGTDPQLGANLHLRCPNPDCSRVFCRGCRRDVTGCQPNCNPLDSCSLRSCCSDVRAMAIFEHLSVFDDDYLARVRNLHHGAADAHTNANRLSFLAHAFDPANRRDPRYRGFINVLKRTLKYVRFWLEPSVSQNVTCSSVAQMLAASFLLEVVRAFLTQGVQTIENFRARGHLIRRIVAFLSTLSCERSGPIYDLVGKSPVVIDQSPGLRSLIWVLDSVWQGHFSPGEDPVILESMRDLWTRLENEAGSESLRGVANEIDTGLYQRGRDLSLFERA